MFSEIGNPSHDTDIKERLEIENIKTYSALTLRLGFDFGLKLKKKIIIIIIIKIRI